MLFLVMIKDIREGVFKIKFFTVGLYNSCFLFNLSLSFGVLDRCPVCRYCQTPEPVEENKCFECGVQEVSNAWWERIMNTALIVGDFFLPCEA